MKKKQQNKSKEISVEVVSNGGLDTTHSENYCIVSQYTDKKGFKITLDMLQKLWEQCEQNNKTPMLIIGIKNGEHENFVLHCSVEKERVH